MIMKEEFVTLETSKLLKKKGFNEFCKYAYADEDLHLALIYKVTLDSSS